MQKGRATIKDIANALNVSISTVSRALGDHPDVSEVTRKRVQELAETIHYSPNLQAKYLRTHSSGIVALILPEINMFFTPGVMNGINQYIEEKGYSLMVLLSDNSYEKEKKLVDYCSRLAVDGVMVSLSKETSDLSHLEELSQSGMPIILLDRILNSNVFPSISINGTEAAYMASNYLLNNGHNKISGIFGYSNLQITKLRILGFQKAFEDRHIKSDPKAILKVEDMKKFDSYMDKSGIVENATAIFTMSDELLAKTYHYLLKNNIKVPEQISLISISDGELPYHLYPKITHILHSGYHIGQTAATYLIQLIKGQEILVRDYEAKTKLIELESVKRIDNGGFPGQKSGSMGKALSSSYTE
jgi:LacI family transcriptional regulator